MAGVVNATLASPTADANAAHFLVSQGLAGKLVTRVLEGWTVSSALLALLLLLILYDQGMPARQLESFKRDTIADTTSSHVHLEQRLYCRPAAQDPLHRPLSRIRQPKVRGIPCEVDEWAAELCVGLP